jgi:hypothetical protein
VNSLSELSAALAGLRCHKIVLFDACHSGGLSTDLIREFTVDGVGPVVLAACGPAQSAWEHPLLDSKQTYGLFAMAIRRSLTREFEDADVDGNGRLEVGELSQFVMRRVPELFEMLRKDNPTEIGANEFQHPLGQVPDFEKSLPLSRRQPKRE